MIKNKLMVQFKQKFGGEYIKENGRLHWSKDGFKEQVTYGFLKHYLDKQKDPSVNNQNTVVSKTVSTVVSETVSTVKQPPKKVKKDVVKDPANTEISEGS
jgi:hypothetical protein